jgi:hypothetical protein
MAKAGSKRPTSMNIDGAEWLTPAGVRQILGGISRSTFWRLRAQHGLPRGQRPGGLDLELISVAALRRWMSEQPNVEEVTSSRGRRGGARLNSQEMQSGVAE